MQRANSDADGDRISDLEDWDFDNDGLPDYLDLDADGDGVLMGKIQSLSIPALSME